MLVSDCFHLFYSVRDSADNLQRLIRPSALQCAPTMHPPQIASSRISPPRTPLPLCRALNTITSQRADVCPSQPQDPSTTAIFPSLKAPHPPPSSIEKIVQRYSLGLAKDQIYVKTGGFVTLTPHCYMMHGKRIGSELGTKTRSRWE